MVRLSVLSMAVTLLFYPWVVDAVLWHYLKGQAVGVEKREVTYSGIQYQGVTFSRDGTAIAIGNVSIPSFGSLAGLSANSRPVVIENLLVDLSNANSEKAESETKASFSSVLQTVFTTLPTLETVLPTVRISDVELTLSASRRLTIKDMQWRAGQLTVLNGKWSGELPEDWREHISKPELTYLHMGRRGSEMLYIMADFSDSLTMEGHLSLAQEGRSSTTLQLNWAEGKLDLIADWDASGWLPAACTMNASATGLPFFISNPTAPVYPSLEIAAEYDLQTSAFTLELNGSGQYQLADSDRAPLPWKLSILAGGNAREIQISSLEIDVPGLQASLSNSLTLDRSRWAPSEAACFEWDVDLSSGIFPGLEGIANGTICLDPAIDRESAAFRFSGAAMDILLPPTIWPERVQRIDLSGEGTLDAQAIRAGNLDISASDLLQLTGQLTWNWQDTYPETVNLQGRALPALISRWVPKDQITLPADGISFSFNGTHQDTGWEHSGDLSIAEATLLEGYKVDVAFQWQGKEMAIESWSTHLDHGDLRLSSSGSLDWKPDRVAMQIDTFEEQFMAEVSWNLANTVNLVFSPGSADIPASVDCRLFEIEFKNGGKLTFEGRWSGWSDLSLKGTATNLALSSFDAWIDNPRLMSSSIAQMTFFIKTESGLDGNYSWSGNGDFQANWITRENLLVAGSGGWMIADKNIEFSELVIAVDGSNWFTIDGTLPVRLIGTPEKPFDYRIEANDPLEINFQLQPVETLPRLLADRLPFTVQDLQARARASGSLARPVGEILATAGKLTWREQADDTLYSVNDLSIDAAVDVESLLLKHLSLRLPDAGKAESIQAEISNVDWVTLIEGASNYPWNELSGFVKIDRWPVAALGSFLPGGFLPQGQFSVDLAKAVGEWPIGDLNFNGLSWRALDAGIIAREIAGKAHLEGRKLDALEMTASVGGGIVRIGGWMDFEELRDPRFRIGLESDRFDLVRRSNLILRGSSDIEAVYEKSDPVPRLQGDIELIRSLWLRDLQDFTRKGVAGVTQRPPYFSLKTKPFVDWRLDMNIFGQNFLRLQSTLLTGTASTEFKLRGTLGDPLLVGNVTLADGAIIFPFASLKTTGIEAWITEDEPHIIQLSGSGEGVVYGHIVQYQLSGTSELPAITFTSIPSLAQHEILLMLTTGAVPSAELTANINERTRRIGFFIGQDIFSSLIGRDGASKLEFRTGDGFSPFRREGQLLEYRINDKWSIIGEYDDFGGYNVDVRRILLQR